MNTRIPNSPDVSSTRREMIFGSCGALGSVALNSLLTQNELRASDNSGGFAALAPKSPHFAARAKSMIYLVMEGGPSQIDTFDPKPALNRHHGKVFARENVKTNQVKGKRFFVRSPFRFRNHGECGMPVSELFQETGACADDLAVVRSVYGDSDNHPAALFQYNTGFPVQGNPSIGAWMVYGLGSENQNLPAFVVLRDGKPFGGTSTWGNGFLPALYQGTQFRGGKTPVLDLQPPAGVTRSDQRSNLDLLKQLNQKHQSSRPDQPDLEARIAAYELAFRMQTEIPETVDLQSEPQHVHKMYGLDQDHTKAFGQRCLLARRLVERGVRFVQLWSGGWDSHGDVAGGHRSAARRVDRPIAGLLRDLKQRGLLEDTLVVWGGEFGRTADTNEAQWTKQQPGRDHNPKAMTMWFAGGGTKGGTIVGATDEVGDRAVEPRHHLNDVHATLQHLMGLDQHKLTYYHGGRLKRLTNLGGEIIQGIIS